MLVFDRRQETHDPRSMLRNIFLLSGRGKSLATIFRHDVHLDDVPTRYLQIMPMHIKEEKCTGEVDMSVRKERLFLDAFPLEKVSLRLCLSAASPTKPEITGPTQVEAGVNATWRCNTSGGFPFPRLAWKRGGQSVSRDVRFQSTTNVKKTFDSVGALPPPHRL